MVGKHSLDMGTTQLHKSILRRMCLTSRGVLEKRSTGFAVQFDLRSHSTAASCPSAAARCLHWQAVNHPLCPPCTSRLTHKNTCINNNAGMSWRRGWEGGLTEVCAYHSHSTMGQKPACASRFSMTPAHTALLGLRGCTCSATEHRIIQECTSMLCITQAPGPL